MRVLGAAAGGAVAWWLFTKRRKRTASGAAAAIFIGSSFSVLVNQQQRITEAFDVAKTKTIVSGATTLPQLADAAQEHPDTMLLKAMNVGLKAGNDASAAINAMWASVRPAFLNADFDPAKLTKDDITHDIAALDAAQAKLSTIEPGCKTTFKRELEQIKTEADKAAITDSISHHLILDVADRQNVMAGCRNETVAATHDFWQALRAQFSVMLVRGYKVSNDQVLFSTDEAVNDFNAAGEASAAALQRLKAIDDEEKKFVAGKQAAWNNMMKN
ncbi:MAG TPA: hypothetical protein VGJ20_11720 [Xanthobacteraceae bacterium]